MRFERKVLSPAKYKIGDHVMGYHTGIGTMGLVAGTIIAVNQETSVFSENSYQILLEKEFELSKNSTLSLKEDEIVVFDKQRFLSALSHAVKDREYRQKSIDEYRALIKNIYSKEK